MMFKNKSGVLLLINVIDYEKNDFIDYIDYIIWLDSKGENKVIIVEWNFL